MEVRRERTCHRVSVVFAVLAAFCSSVVAVLLFSDGETVSGWAALLAAAANVATAVPAVRGAEQSTTQDQTRHRARPRSGCTAPWVLPD